MKTGMCAAAAVALIGAAGAAQAGLEICNDTDAFQSVAIGYLGSDWTSEGWWLLEPGGCVDALPGDLQQRYYYYHAVADDMAFQGDGYSFCTLPDAFTIVGSEDCQARGYDSADFKEIDTGETALHHVERIALTDSIAVEDNAPDTGPVPDSVEQPPTDDTVVTDGDMSDDGPDDDMSDDDFFDDGADNPRRGTSRG